MGEIVNLNKARKARARDEQTREAAENRIRFGRAKGERRKTDIEVGKAEKDLDGKRLD